MYEDKAFEAILKEMLDRVPTDVDKREGSIIHDALAPAAAEMAALYVEMDTVLSLGFGTTSSGGYLDLRAADFGVTRQAATPSQRKGLFFATGNTPFDVPIGSRFGIGELTFVVKEKLADGEFKLECETAGEAGNVPAGAILPINYISGLATAELADVLVPGEDEETDAALRERYLYRVHNPSSGGNKADYRDWALEVAGVGGAKVYPLWNGAGTVKVVIVDSVMEPASSTLVTETADYIETVRPIGATVTVVSATSKAITIGATVTLAAGYTLQNVSDAFTATIESYFHSISFAAQYVSIAQVGTLLLGTPGVLDYSGLTLNGGSSNVALAAEEIPGLDSVELEV